jgi:putative ABC transport system permease protein
MLALSVIVSLFGMVNMLLRAVYERTRELGTERGGHDPHAGRRMVRHESVMTRWGSRSACS